VSNPERAKTRKDPVEVRDSGGTAVAVTDKSNRPPPSEKRGKLLENFKGKQNSGKNQTNLPKKKKKGCKEHGVNSRVNESRHGERQGNRKARVTRASKGSQPNFPIGMEGKLRSDRGRLQRGTGAEE